MRAQLTLAGTIYDLVTNANGDLSVPTAPDGVQPFTIVLINGVSYTGNVTVTNGTGYFDVTATPTPPSAVPLMLAVAVVGMGIVGYMFWRYAHG